MPWAGWWGPGPGVRGGGASPLLGLRRWGMHSPLPSFAFSACPALPAPQLSLHTFRGTSSPKPCSISHFKGAASPSCHALSPLP